MRTLGVFVTLIIGALFGPACSSSKQCVTSLDVTGNVPDSGPIDCATICASLSHNRSTSCVLGSLDMATGIQNIHCELTPCSGDNIAH